MCEGLEEEEGWWVAKSSHTLMSSWEERGSGVAMHKSSSSAVGRRGSDGPVRHASDRAEVEASAPRPESRRTTLDALSRLPQCGAPKWPSSLPTELLKPRSGGILRIWDRGQKWGEVKKRTKVGGATCSREWIGVERPVHRTTTP
jgi:hypothetical protein